MKKRRKRWFLFFAEEQAEQLDTELKSDRWKKNRTRFLDRYFAPVPIFEDIRSNQLRHSLIREHLRPVQVFKKK